MASGYLANLLLAGKVNVIWSGGGKWPDGGEEFNLSNDIQAAKVVFKSNLQIWQVPRNI